MQVSYVHQRFAENVSDDRGERLLAFDMRKAPVAGKAGRREPHYAADSRTRFPSLPFPLQPNLDQPADGPTQGTASP
jgi:hypothetical protein